MTSKNRTSDIPAYINQKKLMNTASKLHLLYHSSIIILLGAAIFTALIVH